ncbi:MAG: hypothetical protein HY589_05370, partial [Candidatus Omnitrophica bacterium]|nr:hypothetical protein [Candidatus Omnitrophota bacterium]
MVRFFEKRDLLLVALIFISLIAISFSGVIFFDEVFVRRDISRYYQPLRTLSRQIFSSGAFPLWNPYLFCGVPLFASIQTCVLYPVSIIYYIGDFLYMFNIFILFHVFLAGVFMYCLMKDWGLSKMASLFSAFSFAFSGYMMGAINLTISLSSAAWFPPLLYFYRKKRPIFTALTLVMMLLAGDPAIVFISVAVLGCISFYFFIEALAEKRRPYTGHLGLFFFSASLFLFLSAFQTIPFLEFFSQSNRKALSWEMASLWSVPPADLVSLVIPFFNDINWAFGNYWGGQSWLDNYYMGLVALCLAFTGAFFDKSKK